MKTRNRKPQPALQKSATEIIRARAQKWQGELMVDVRLWYTNAGGELRPSRKGLALPPHMWRALLPLIEHELNTITEPEEVQ